LQQRLPTRFLLTLAALLTLGDHKAHADGGAVQLSEVVGPYRLSVFTSPTPLHTGPVDVSMLVQDASTNALVPDAIVTFHLSPQNSPDETVTATASRAAATNKLLQAAQIELSQSGIWILSVEVDGPLGDVKAECNLEIGEAWPHWLSLLPWILWPALPVGLFLVHMALVRRRQAKFAPN
jgi:hypothetical protein